MKNCEKPKPAIPNETTFSPVACELSMALEGQSPLKSFVPGSCELKMPLAISVNKRCCSHQAVTLWPSRR